MILLLLVLSCGAEKPESKVSESEGFGEPPKTHILQEAVDGEIDRLGDFPSALVLPRNIDVWLPENYDGEKKFSVLYMHDGQMLFDPANTWNKQSWNVDDVVSLLLQKNKIQDLIIVGIWNIGDSRMATYFPEKPFNSLSPEEKGFVNNEFQKASRTKEVFKPVSDNYLKFITTELKPYIDEKYSVYSDAKNTFIGGSSMGGLISMYAICEYPKVFGGAACMSTHWPGIFSLEDNPIPATFINYLKNNLPDPSSHKIYFDHGDQTLDALYASVQIKVDAVMKAKGYTDQNWKTLTFEGKDHSEKSWNERFDKPVVFLLGKE